METRRVAKNQFSLRLTSERDATQRREWENWKVHFLYEFQSYSFHLCWWYDDAKCRMEWKNIKQFFPSSIHSTPTHFIIRTHFFFYIFECARRIFFMLIARQVLLFKSKAISIIKIECTCKCISILKNFLLSFIISQTQKKNYLKRARYSRLQAMQNANEIFYEIMKISIWILICYKLSLCFWRWFVKWSEWVACLSVAIEQWYRKNIFDRPPTTRAQLNFSVRFLFLLLRSSYQR